MRGGKETDSATSLDGDRIQLTDAGFRQAEKIVRQHRLAKRLLIDVLNISPAKVEEVACEFEHMVAEEVTDGICTLLGHPRTCPAGAPIPEGPCCRSAAGSTEAAVVPLTEHAQALVDVVGLAVSTTAGPITFRLSCSGQRTSLRALTAAVANASISQPRLHPSLEDPRGS